MPELLWKRARWKSARVAMRTAAACRQQQQQHQQHQQQQQQSTHQASRVPPVARRVVAGGDSTRLKPAPSLVCCDSPARLWPPLAVTIGVGQVG